MGRLKRLALWCCAALMAVTAVAVGEADPAWATSPTDTADAPGVEAATAGDAVDVTAAPLGRVSGAAEAAGLRPAGRSRLVLASSHCQHGQWSSGRCRACPVGQVWITGTGCVVATDPRQCSSYMGPSSVSYTVPRLSSSTAYRFQLRAANARGAGAASEIAATTLAAASPPASVPAAPAGLTGVGGNRSIALSWNNPSDSSILEYQFRERPAGETAWRCWRRLWSSTSASTGHTMGWITNGVNYQVQVRALNAAGTGPASQTAATPTAARPPGP